MTRRHRTQPNDRTQRAAAKLHGIGPTITEAVTMIRDELSTLGYAGSSSRGEGRANGSLSSPAERDAIAVHQLTNQREDLRDAITDVSERIDALVRLVHHICGRDTPNADGHALCCDRQQGREGSFHWGDPTCTELPVQSSLCFRCYQSERRWRQANGLADRTTPAA